MRWDLRDRVALITGAARGVGAETARRGRGAGARLVLVDVDADPLKELATELREGVTTAVADVRDLSAVQHAVGTGVQELEGIDVVVADAGIASYGSVLAVDPETFALRDRHQRDGRVPAPRSRR